MKPLIIKADRAVLDILSRIIQKWVVKHEQKLHKVDFLIRWDWVELAACALCTVIVPTAIYLAGHQPVAAAIHDALWGAILVIKIFGIRSTKQELKRLYDYLWPTLQENPDYARIYSQTLDEQFVETRRKRLELSALLIGITASLFIVSALATTDAANTIVWNYLFANSLSGRLKNYVMYVKDFDKPKKKKKASEAISELLQNLWGQFIGGLTPPQPAYQRVNK